jgi:hypothetical protein
MMLLSCLAAAVAGGALPAWAQGRRPKPDAPLNVKSLDDKAAALEQDYLNGLFDLAQGYEDAGLTEKAKTVLQDILKLKPDAELVKARLKELDEAVFDENVRTVEVDVAKGWMFTGFDVKRDAPIRFTAEGTYRFILNESIGPDGLSHEDVMRDMAAGVPSGALMGLIVPPPKQGQRQPDKPGAPFAIGASREFSPSEDGKLLLRMNLPPGTKSVGKIKVTISGNLRAAQ